MNSLTNRMLKTVFCLFQLPARSLKLNVVGFVLVLLAVPAFAAGENKAAVKEDAHGPREDVQEAVQVIQKMQSDAEVNKLLEQAKGIFVVPDYATAALIVGGAGGEGVLIPKHQGEWGHPAFYNIGGASAGLQAGVAAGSIALILMNQEALESFKQENNFSLTAAAGVSIVNWSARAQAQAVTEEDDIVAWTDTEGLFGEVSIGVSDINWDDEDNTAYYGEEVTATQIISGEIPSSRKQEIGQVTEQQ